MIHMSSRRDFLKTGAIAGGGLVLSIVLPDIFIKAGTKSSPRPFAPNAFLRITEDNKISVVLSKVEMGQGIWTTLPMLIAEELDCELSQIKVEHSPPGKEYFHTFIPGQLTVGSTSTMSEFDRYRKAGATAREMLISAAAAQLGVNAQDCRTEKGFVINGNNKLSYGSLSTAAAMLPVPEVALRESKAWKIIGKSQRRLDAEQKVNGSAIYGIDVKVEGVLTALVLHAPIFGSKVKSFDSTEALNVPGVKQVVQIPGAVAVIADNFWSAKKGREVLRVEWEIPNEWLKDSEQQKQEYRNLAQTKGEPTQEKGNLESGFAKASKILEAEYWVPYLAHACMEPLNCTIKISEDGCEIWTGTQMPMVDRDAAARILNLSPEKVKLNTPFLGGGFGRRGSLVSDWVVEAAEIVKASGKSIKMIWTREDDMKAGFYRPSYCHSAKIGLSKDGFPVAWQHRIVGQGVFRHTFVMPDPKTIDLSSVEGVKSSPYLDNVPDHSVELHTIDNNVPVLPWRSVGKSHTCFVIESLIDEMASASKKDPVEYRRGMLKNQPQYLGVLNSVAERSGWGKSMPTNYGRGVAVYDGNGSYVAYVVEIKMSGQKFKIDKVWCAVDCGIAVNPDGVKAQMESSIIFGLTAAVFGEITFKEGMVEQSNFTNYKMMEMKDAPEIHIEIISSGSKIGGIGEPGVPAIAPALCNAIFNASGKRIRNLPVKI
ncbi:MAG: twin-arginine translocation pathway signal protein [Bacteroidetes bacterium]|nr:MAG: twin-arginine translocation pathway signal protein [Bacteroidota bacterium]